MTCLSCPARTVVAEGLCAECVRIQPILCLTVGCPNEVGDDGPTRCDLCAERASNFQQVGWCTSCDRPMPGSPRECSKCRAGRASYSEAWT